VILDTTPQGRGTDWYPKLADGMEGSPTGVWHATHAQGIVLATTHRVTSSCLHRIRRQMRSRLLQGSNPAVSAAPKSLTSSRGASKLISANLEKLLMKPHPFQIQVKDAVLDDLRARLGRTRRSPDPGASGWKYGTDPEYLDRFVEYWRAGFDWRQQEAQLNTLLCQGHSGVQRSLLRWR
jgi:hypothetical protein